MEYKLKNAFLEATFSSKGAELKSLIYKNQELMLNDEAYWNYTSPYLFPIVGALKDGYTNILGKEFKIPKHGVIRTALFDLEDETENRLTFVFFSSEDMLTVYPYRFKFAVTYFLEKNQLHTTIKITNLSENTMPFNLGLHPAFSTKAFNGKFTDYTIKFEKSETLALPVIEKNGTLNFNKTRKNISKETLLSLSYQDYEEDALVYKHLKSRKVSLNCPHYIIDFTFPSFSSLGIWTKVEAPFICLEPWIGHGDKENSNHQFTEKDDLVTLKPAKTKIFNFTWQIKKSEKEE